MANVHVTFRDVVHVGGSSIVSRNPRAAETNTSSGTSAATTISALEGEVIQVATDGTIYVKVGSSPTAVADDGDMFPAGVYQVGLAVAGDKVAFKDV